MLGASNNHIFISSDHAGFELKNQIKEFLKINKISYTDLGPQEYDENDDYPKLIKPVAEKVSNQEGLGIIIGGSGQGEAIVANRIKGVRAIVYNNENLDLIKLGREHNNANILSIGARFVSSENAKDAVLLFLQTPFTYEDRHERRVIAIDYE